MAGTTLDRRDQPLVASLRATPTLVPPVLLVKRSVAERGADLAAG